MPLKNHFFALLIFFFIAQLSIAQTKTIKVKKNVSGSDTTILSGTYIQNICISQTFKGKLKVGFTIQKIFINGAEYVGEFGAVGFEVDLSLNGINKGDKYEIKIVASPKGTWKVINCNPNPKK